MLDLDAWKFPVAYGCVSPLARRLESNKIGKMCFSSVIPKKQLYPLERYTEVVVVSE